NDLTNISFYSIVGFTCIAFILTSFLLLTIKISLFIKNSCHNVNYLFVIISIIILASVSYWVVDLSAYHILFLILLLLPLILADKIKHSQRRFVGIIVYLLLFSGFSNFITFNCNSKVEKEKRKLMAIRISRDRDPIAEFRFSDTYTKIQNDSVLRQMLLYVSKNYENEPEITQYLKRNYFSGYWTKFDVLITICDTDRMLDIQPENYIVYCNEYFDAIIDSSGISTLSENLYYLDFDFGADNYIGRFEFGEGASHVSVFIELFSKEIPRGPGYPELLIDEEVNTISTNTEYSWSKFRKDELVYAFGKYQYSTKLAHYNIETEDIAFFDLDNYNHLLYKCGTNAYIISKKQVGFIELISPFSYLFLFYGLIFIILTLIFRSPVTLNLHDLNFRKRLQLSMISLIVSSFIMIGIVSLIYIVNLNDDKNHDILSEKSHSVLIELEHKLADEEQLSPEIQDYLGDLLYKFSLVFFSDINLFDLNGSLLASSRPELFTKGLISDKIHPVAYEEILGSDKSMFIHSENIGSYRYLSAYVPFRNSANNRIAILNLPYFARQDELTSEIATFMVAIVNIYVILIVISIIVALIISNYVSKPLQLIRDKIGRLKLSKTNEKIEWGKKDEIGSLVGEYNRMIDELARSADMLAQSERESAWREMAKQVAHEIKNPLTPMKLSVQHLKKAWDEQAPDYPKRMEQFTKNIIGQIDSLSVIASEFSNFAKMPLSRNRQIEITDVLKNAVDLFMDTTSTRLVLYADPDQKYVVLADKEQLLRVFNNLIKNSIQAVPQNKDGLIEITIRGDQKRVYITVKDNGIGIPEDQRDKVFYPSFTTKTSGMGLGLALSKNIILNAGGSIRFESEEGRGTTFFIELPLINM
ncbi:MAG: HAMP domain-containing histidine kinase, partial [Bacteroidales bacterium]|nr:HAMP domain-containing histidine kinase [Bacteroidales bacterium]